MGMERDSEPRAPSERGDGRSGKVGRITNPPSFPFDGAGVCDACRRPTDDLAYVGSLAPGPTGVLCGPCFDETAFPREGEA